MLMLLLIVGIGGMAFRIIGMPIGADHAGADHDADPDHADPDLVVDAKTFETNLFLNCHGPEATEHASG
ncbi:hypothetical protein ACFFWD_03480 [Bradyrhizobium erythrophlei]|uniref:hypothetical protein n=1 Tax=Bradyrhizobium erythrophlei TaxID=1437360 RepID=UPI0035E4843E